MIRFWFISFICTTFFGCAYTGVYSRTSSLFHGIFKEGKAVGGGVIGTKKGRSCSKNIMGFSSGDSSILTAARNGGITKIATVDSEYENILFISGKHCTIVTGE